MLVMALFFTGGTMITCAVAAAFAPVVALLMFAIIAGLFKQERGATAIEYAFIASLISIAIYATAITVGTNLTTTFTSVAGKL